jgi:hypothetical protein
MMKFLPASAVIATGVSGFFLIFSFEKKQNRAMTLQPVSLLSKSSKPSSPVVSQEYLSEQAWIRDNSRRGGFKKT